MNALQLNPQWYNSTSKNKNKNINENISNTKIKFCHQHLFLDLLFPRKKLINC